MSAADYIIIFVILAAAVAAVFGTVRKGGSCGSCPYSGSCAQKKGCGVKKRSGSCGKCVDRVKGDGSPSGTG